MTFMRRADASRQEPKKRERGDAGRWRPRAPAGAIGCLMFEPNVQFLD